MRSRHIHRFIGWCSLPALIKYFNWEDYVMEIHKTFVLDEDQRPIAVQIPIEEFERLEEVIENYGLAKMIDAVLDDEQLSVQEAKTLYRSMKENVES